MTFACACGRLDAKQQPLGYADCCGRYLDDFANTPAPDAESLMRSRYTAFVRERDDYLLVTWHASTRPAAVDLDRSQRWLGLQLKSHRTIDATHAGVAFVARSRDASGRASRLAECSRFVREQGRWYYVDGRFD